MNVIFMGTPAFAVPALRALLTSSHRVVAVYSQPPRPAGRGMQLTPSPIQQLAEEHQLPVFTPERLSTPEAQQQFAAHAADIAVVAAYGLLLPAAILAAPTHGCINIHPSDLPRWRGAAPIQRTLMAGDTITACCIMQMDAGLDTGAVLMREAYTIPSHMNAGELQEAMATRGAALLLETLANWPSITAIPQSAEGITYAKKISKEDPRIDWSQPAAAIINQMRGLSPMPGAITTFDGEVIKLFEATIERGDTSQPAGKLLDNQLLINCGDGQALRILMLQRSGKTRQKAADFLKGFAITAGKIAGSCLAHG